MLLAQLCNSYKGKKEGNFETRGPWTLALCLTAAFGMALAIFCRLSQLLYEISFPMSTATTHIGSSCACSGGQSRFGLGLVNDSTNQKQFRSATPKQSYHCFALSSPWWRSGYTFNQWPSSPNCAPSFIE